MQVPNVLVVKAQGFDPETSEVLYFPYEVPNMKQNRAYYLTFLTHPMQTEFRIYHVRRATPQGEQHLKFDLGNSFVTELEESMDGFPRFYVYQPLSYFGLQQVSESLLIKVQPLPVQASQQLGRRAI